MGFNTITRLVDKIVECITTQKRPAGTLSVANRHYSIAFLGRTSFRTDGRVGLPTEKAPRGDIHHSLSPKAAFTPRNYISLSHVENRLRLKADKTTDQPRK